PGNFPVYLAKEKKTIYFSCCSAVSEKEAAMVLSDYPASDVCEPIFHAGEWLRVLSDDGYWLKVYSIQTREENYIPNSHAAKVYHGWLFEGVERVKAEELLRLPGNRVGSFLIRVSRRGTYALSVRHRVIMHYRIFRLPNNWYFISPRLTFQCLEDLVSHYSDVADGLCCVLTGPCLAAPDPSQNLPSLPARMGRSWNFNRGAGDRHQSRTLSRSSSTRMEDAFNSVQSFRLTVKHKQHTFM
uniref:Src like adaptor n=1 Tax=Astyanax mexicanus TaxID=7994 RepID=A0A8B9L3P8_ASTMX